MKNNKKRNWKKIIGSICAIIVLLLIGAIVVLRLAINPRDNENSRIKEIALDKTSIKTIDRYYHLSRDKKSVALKGKSKKGKTYYFIYLPASKKAYLYDTKQGKSQQTVINQFSVDHPNRTIKTVNLGWYEKRAVWEIRYTKKNGKSGFVIYDFKTGEELSYIDNL